MVKSETDLKESHMSAKPFQEKGNGKNVLLKRMMQTFAMILLFSD